MEQHADIVYRVREFNRFYTAAPGMLNRKFIDSGYSVAESRILFELNVNGYGWLNGTEPWWAAWRW